MVEVLLYGTKRQVLHSRLIVSFVSAGEGGGATECFEQTFAPRMARVKAIVLVYVVYLVIYDSG